MRRADRRGRATSLALLAGAAATMLFVAGCGSSSKSPSAAESAQHAGIVQPGASTQSSRTTDAVATVDGTPIAKASYEHWLAVDRALGVAHSPQHHALGFLITSSWILGEAAKRHISVRNGEVHKRLANLEAKSFPKAGATRAYLRRSHQTTADLQARVKVELLQGRIAEEVTKGKPKTQHEAVLAAFERHFAAHWKALTSCKPGYVMEDCKEYKGAPEPQSTGASASAGSSATGSGATASTSSSSSSGEVYGSPGSFALSSPAFTRNGQVPAKYTCAGAGVSPPLTWSNVPKGASELVLFVIDDSSNGSEGGVRWIVGGIDPSSDGVEAGQTPAGAVVGTNTAGKTAYSPICPANGKTDTIEFVMYALKHPISLSSGFAPSTAEQEYGSSKDVLGEAATTYAVATGT